MIGFTSLVYSLFHATTESKGLVEVRDNCLYVNSLTAHTFLLDQALKIKEERC